MEQEQKKGTTVHQSTRMRKNSRVDVSNNFPNKKIALGIIGNGTVTIKTNPDENTTIKIKVRRRTRIIRRA